MDLELLAMLQFGQPLPPVSPPDLSRPAADSAGKLVIPREIF